MILNHVNHKMPIYKDCTLGEMLVVGGINFTVMSTIFSLLTSIFIGFAWIGFALSILLLVHATRFCLGRLQKIKYGKPYGYYRQWFLKKFNLHPCVIHQIKWSVRRELPHVKD
jgi:conjugative transfer region protein (TIGR03750 family)